MRTFTSSRSADNNNPVDRRVLPPRYHILKGPTRPAPAVDTIGGEEVGGEGVALVLDKVPLDVIVGNVTLGSVGDDREVEPPPSPPPDPEHVAVAYSTKKVVEHQMPLHPFEQGKSRNTVGIGLGQPQDCVTVARPRHAGTMQEVQSSRVAVTVGQPVWNDDDGVPVTDPPLESVVAVTPVFPAGSWAMTDSPLFICQSLVSHSCLRLRGLTGPGRSR
jgi:hypothetical protein